MLVPILCERCVCVCVCVRACACVCVCLCACMRLCMCVSLSVCVLVHVHMCVCIHTCESMHICVYMHVRVWVCVHVCIICCSSPSITQKVVVGLVLKSYVFTLKNKSYPIRSFYLYFKNDVLVLYTLKCQKYGCQFCGQKLYIFFGLQLLYCQCDGVLCVKMIFCNQKFIIIVFQLLNTMEGQTHFDL